MAVDTPSIAYTKQQPRWELLHDLLGGTEAMREAGVKWLPKEQKEKPLAYKNRLERSVLFNGYENTVSTLSAKPFGEPVTLEGSLPKELRLIEGDADRNGTDLTSFLKQRFWDAAVYGRGHILVDMPRTAERINLKEQLEQDVRAYFVGISPADLIGWRTERINGKDVLTQVRFKECRDEAKGEYEDEEVEYIRVYTPTTWELWKKTKDDREYQRVDSGDNPLGVVPMVTFYFGPRVARPPLMNLAWLNLEHWQKSSDQNNILRFMRVGMYKARGVTQEEIDKGFVVGANQVWSSKSKDADFGTIEFSGGAAEIGQKDLERLEARMEIEGMRPFIERTQGVLATGQVINASHTLSHVQAWIRAVESASRKAYELAARWHNVELPDDFKTNVFNEFDIAYRGQQDLPQLLQMALNGKLSDETFLKEVRRRGVISEAVDVEEELGRIEGQGPEEVDVGPDEAA